MTIRQKVLKAVYPAYMWLSKLAGKNNKEFVNHMKQPQVSFYGLKDTLNSGQAFDFSSLAGKKVLIVNTASDCGFTNQYQDLQQLYKEEKDRLVVLGFPANDFKEQEKGTDAEIAEFCKLNFGISFPLMKKSTVIEGPGQNKVFRWLTDPGQNGWNNQPPTWNFTKFLVNEQGMLTHYFGPSVSPLSKEVREAINEK
jgi:glutathione peroxidase